MISQRIKKDLKSLWKRLGSLKVTCPKCKRRIRIRRGDTIKCKCGNNLSYRSFFRDKFDYDVYLIDANVLIYAAGKGPYSVHCRKVASFGSDDVRIGTTRRIISEVGAEIEKRFSKDMIVFNTGLISDELSSLKTNYLKQPSEADLSLIQAARQHPEVRGIITYDRDFGRIAASGIIEKRSSVKFWLGNAREFLERYEIRSKLGKRI